MSDSKIRSLFETGWLDDLTSKTNVEGATICRPLNYSSTAPPSFQFAFKKHLHPICQHKNQQRVHQTPAALSVIYFPALGVSAFYFKNSTGPLSIFPCSLNKILDKKSLNYSSYRQLISCNLSSASLSNPKQNTKLLNVYYTNIRRRIRLLDGRVHLECVDILPCTWTATS